MKTKEEIENLAAEKYPYEENPNNDLGIREWNQRKHDQREAFVSGFMACGVCGDYFEMSNLTSVVIHEHSSIEAAHSIGIHGIKMGNDLYPNEYPQFWAGANSHMLGDSVPDSRESDNFKRGYYTSMFDKQKME